MCISVAINFKSDVYIKMSEGVQCEMDLFGTNVICNIQLYVRVANQLKTSG